jgi:hypothetical protein
VWFEGDPGRGGPGSRRCITLVFTETDRVDNERVVPHVAFSPSGHTQQQAAPL